jgi:hypothetical protein
VYAITRDGAVYHNFELVLPRGAQIFRRNDHSFSLDTKRFSLGFEIIFNGFSSNLPSDFEELYLGQRFGEIQSYSAEIGVDVKFKLINLFSRTGWQYYKWIDLFLNNLENDFKFDLFLKRISWDMAYTVATIRKQQI